MIVGIDLGTTNSLVGVYQEGHVKLIPNAFGEYLTPSVVALDDNDDIIVGKIAKERLVTHPDKTLSQFKRFMGSKHELVLGDRTYKAEELSSFIIRKLVDDAETFLSYSYLYGIFVRKIVKTSDSIVALNKGLQFKFLVNFTNSGYNGTIEMKEEIIWLQKCYIPAYA